MQYNDINLQELAKSNEESLTFISKEMGNLARRLKKTPFTEERMEQYQTNLVEAAFFLNSYAMGTRAFNKMIKDKEADPGCDKKLPEYFMDEINYLLDMGKNEENN